MSETTPATAGDPQPINVNMIDKIAGALAKAQGEFPVIPKNSEVIVYSKDTKKELYRYKYADLTTIIACTRPAMAKHGLSFTQHAVAGGFITLIMHESGQQLKAGYIPCEIGKSQDMKQVAATVTYIKRISLTAALGVSADEDVDAGAMEANRGNRTERQPASNSKPQGQQKPAGNKPAQRPNASQELIDQMYGLCIDRGISEGKLNQLISKGYGVPAKGNFPEWVAREICGILDNEDCNEDTIDAQTQKVASRREAARIKAEAEKRQQK